MQRVRKHWDIKLVTIQKRRNYLVSKPSYQFEFFFKKCNSDRNEKTLAFTNQPVYLGLLILEISKIVMYESRYYYVKQK